MSVRQTELTSSEIANLWSTYMSDSMVIRVLSYFLEHVEDENTREILDYAVGLSENHIQTISHIFTQEKAHLPLGFTDKDVNLKAPRLYSDKFFLLYTHNLSRLALNVYSAALAHGVRSDVREFYTECLASQAELYNRSAEDLLHKGIFVRQPSIPMPDKVDFIHKKSFLGGWFGDRRPMTSIEIMDVFSNMMRNVIGKSLLLGFSQVTQSEVVKDFMKRGVAIATKHSEIFGSILSQDHLPSPSISDDQVTKSTVSPFSDKLMMFHTSALITSGIGYYGIAMGSSPRRDLALHYTRLSAEIGKYSIDGAKISIDHGWMEQPPTSPDRKALSKV